METGNLNVENDSRLKKSAEAQKDDELPSYGETVGSETKISTDSDTKLSQSEMEKHVLTAHSNDVNASAPSIDQPLKNPVSSAPSASKGVEENYVPPPMPLPIVQQPLGRGQISQRPITQQAGFQNPSSLNSTLKIPWMPAPSPNDSPDSCLVGLERLEHVDEVILQHRINVEDLASLISNIKYDVKNSAEQLVLTSTQDMVMPLPIHESLQCMEFGLYDENQNRVAHVSRIQTSPYICGSNQPRFHYRIDVSCPPSIKIASIVRTSSIGPKFNVVDPDGNFLLRIRGLSSNCCRDPLASGITYEANIFISSGIIINQTFHVHVYVSRRLPSKIKLIVIGFILTQDRLFAVKYPHSRTGPALLPQNTGINQMQQNLMLQLLQTRAVGATTDNRAPGGPTHDRI